MDEETRRLVMQVLDYVNPNPKHMGDCGLIWKWTEPTCTWCGQQESRTGMIDKILNGEVEYPFHYAIREKEKRG